MRDERALLERCAAAALQQWDVDVESVEFKGVRENATFRVVDTDGAAFALRIHRAGYHTLAELSSEIQWTTALAAAGVDTPRPVPTRDGVGHAIVPFGDGETRHVGLIEWIDGVSLGSLVQRGDDTVGLYRALGALLASMHEQVDRFDPDPSFSRHRLDADALLGDDPWWGRFWQLDEMSLDEADLIDAARAHCRAVLDDYGEPARTFGLIHADLHEENVLVHDGRPFAIDFDDAGFGWHQYDLAVPLVELDGTPSFGAHRDALVDGYRTLRALSDDDLALLPVFLTVRHLVTVGWMHSHANDRGARFQRYLGRAVRSGRDLLDR